MLAGGTCGERGWVGGEGASVGEIIGSEVGGGREEEEEGW